MDVWSLVIYALPLTGITAYYMLRQRRTHRRHSEILQESVAAGLTEPASLHPVIDPAKCLGCGTCVAACPETSHHDVLGLIDGKAALIGPTDCIGHGACKTACPFDAITLVFGTARRGVDIPLLKPNFESNVPGVYVAGELGGMGLIRNALTQGQQALESIAKTGVKHPGALDVLIVGAGPAGLAASLAAKKLGLSYETVEQEALGGTVFQYPRGKLVMTAPVELPIIGKVQFRNTSKEELLEFWNQACKGNDLRISYQERVESIVRQDGVFRVKTAKREITASAILLSIGRRGTPRKLGVAGEDSSKVVYRLIDPEQYRGRKVIVVGGGDSALEAAASVAELGDTTVALSYRGEAFQRAKPRNRQRVDEAVAKGQLKVLLGSQVKEIRADDVVLTQSGKELRLPNDAVIVSAGGILPNDFLKSIGIEVETKWGTV
ncbi:MAG: NAD(P)-binding domain-containing protein [Gammaproteobacteria bacterium]|nr:NAD(P)-binding domain-containing protein [Gammaproteobacteria bacterium]MDE2350130.1 NAD(P)-binding domain-containing protein [Gammaproteobacteria bacterium]